MNYSTETMLIGVLLVSSITIIGGYLIWKKSELEDEDGSLKKLIGYIFLAGLVRFNINNITIPIGLGIAYFMLRRVKKNRNAKKNAILLGTILLIVLLYPIEKDIEQLLYPRHQISSYLTNTLENSGYIYSFSDNKSGRLYHRYSHEDDKGRRLYQTLRQASESDWHTYDINWHYRIYVSNTRFRNLTLDITKEGRYILLDSGEGKQYFFIGSKDFQNLVLEISNDIDHQDLNNNDL